MKKKLIVLGLVSLSLLLGFNLINNFNKNTTVKNTTVENTTIGNTDETTYEASYKKIKSLAELKKQSDLIAEVQGTESYKFMDYSGVTLRISTVKVIDVIKGNKSLKEINIAQTEGLDTEKPPVKGEKLLIFLRKGEDIKDAYIPLGGSQGTYDIVNNSKSKNQITSDIVNDSKLNNKTTVDENSQLKPNSMVNNDILKDLSGNYSDIKKKLAE